MGAGLIRDSIPALWHPRDYLHAVVLFKLSVSMDSSALQRFQKSGSCSKGQRKEKEEDLLQIIGSGNDIAA